MYQAAKTMKARFKLILGRRRNYPLNIELEVYKGTDCRVFISTGVTLESVKQWDASRQLIVRHDYAAPYNAMLKNMIQNIERAELEIENRGGIVTKDMIRRAASNTTSIDEINVVDKFNEYLATEKRRESTLTSYRSFINSLSRFAIYKKHSKSAVLYFSDINKTFAEEYHKFLLTILSPSTVPHVHRVVRFLIKKAVCDGYLKATPYEFFDIRSVSEEQRPSLTSEQLKVLESLTRDRFTELFGEGCNIDIYESAIDQFLFSCYTGLRISDNVSIKKGEIARDAKGLVLQKITKKTGTLVTLPLHILFDGKPQAIAEKYIGRRKNNDSLFLLTNEFSLRNYVMKIFKKIDFPSNISFHTARHTCASLLAEKVDNPFVIKDILGHGHIATSMTYIQKSHKAAEKKLKQINWSNDDSEQECNIMEMCDVMKSICSKKKLSAMQTMLIIGSLMECREKFELIKLWIESSRVKDMSLDVLNEKLQLLVESKN